VYATYVSISPGSTGRRNAFGSQAVSTVRTHVAPAAPARSHVTNLARAAGVVSAAVTAFFAASR
jgi:hypothetical protein